LPWVARASKKILALENIYKEFKACGIWPLDKNAEDGKMTPSEVFGREEWEEVVCIEKVAYINDAREGNVAYYYFVEEEGLLIFDHIVKLVLIEEEQGSKGMSSPLFDIV
jgi:hypothetical protein